MSNTFGTSETVSGPVDVHQVIAGKPREKDTYTGKNIKRPSFPWNDRSAIAFKEVLSIGVSMNGRDSWFTGWGFSRPVMSNVGGVDVGGNWLKPGFMQKADLRQGPVKHIISNMKRLRAREYIKTDEIGVFDEGKIKEYLTFVIRHIAKDWKGSRIVSPDIIEGVYQQPTLKTEILEFNPRTGEPKIVTTLDRDIFIHYIPWEGKKTLNWIYKTWPGIEESLEQCLFYVQTGDGYRNKGFRNGELSYEQFVNSEFEHLKWLAERVGGPSGSHHLGISPEKALYSSCICSQCTRRAKSTSVQ